MARTLRVLIVEDSDDDMLLLVRYLKRQGFDPLHKLVDTVEDLQCALRTFKSEVVLCDYNLPKLNAFTALREVQRTGNDVPFIVISGKVGEEQLIELMKAGAHDVVLKDNLARLVPAIEREIMDANVRRERRRAESRLQDAIDCITEGFVLFDADDRLVLCNQVYKEIYGLTSDLFVQGQRFEDIIRTGAERGQYVDARGRVEDWVAERMGQYRDSQGPIEHELSNGRWVRVNERRTADGGTVGTRTDITKTKLAEQALRESAAQLRLIADNLPVFIAYLDRDLRYRFINMTGSAWYARLRSEIIGKPGVEILGIDGFRQLRPHLNCAAAGETTSFEATVTYPDGMTRDVQCTYIPDVNEQGDVKGVVAMAIDLTERKLQAAEIEEQSQLLNAVMDNVQDCIVACDSDGRLSFFNRATRELHGLPEQPLPPERWTDHYSLYTADGATPLATHEIPLYRALQGESLRDVEIVISRQDGKSFTVLCSGQAMINKQGAKLGAVVSMHDITERRRADEALRESEAQLMQAQKMEAVGQLTGGVAHDFNNLLTVIIGNAQLIRRRLSNDEPMIKQIEAVSSAARRGAELTNRLLAFSRKEALDPELVDARDVVSDMLDMLSRTLGETIEIKTQFKDEPHSVFVDPNLLETSLLNLATNARDAMPDGGTLSIALKHTRLDGRVSGLGSQPAPGEYVLLSVSDTGCGIPAEQVDRIFEPFFTTKAPGKGTGLGLSMVFGFVRQSGGWLEVGSSEGQGTTFRIYLPKMAGAEAQRTRSQVPEPVDSEGHETILVVEDEPGVREIAVTLLKEAGYKVVEAENGAEALAVLRREQDIDLLFTDLVMPGGMTGHDLAVTAKKHWPDLRVLYTSGYTDDVLPDPSDSEETGVLVRKPYEAFELTDKIRAALRKAV